MCGEKKKNMEDVSQNWALEVFENAEDEEEGSGLFEEGETKEKKRQRSVRRRERERK